MLEKIGFVKEILFDKLRSHLIENCEKLKQLYYYAPNVEGTSKIDSDYDCLDKICRDNLEWKNSGWECKFGGFTDWTDLHRDNWSNRSAVQCYKEFWDKKEKHLKASIAHYEAFGCKCEVVYQTGRFYVIQYASHKFIGLPKEFVLLEEARKFDDLTAGELGTMLLGGDVDGSAGLVLAGSSDALGVPRSVKMGEVKSALEVKKEELARKQAEAKEAYELKKKEMEDALQKMRDDMDAQLAVVQGEVEKLKDQVFVLELNIFALRSLFGDTFSLIQLSSGKTSSNPLVLYQKFRFLDEEFALLAARQFKWFTGEHEVTIEIFKNKNVQEVFLPSEKCITFFRTSKDQKYYAYDPELDGLKEWEYYHGTQVGMLIRNGENVWLSFIDEEVFVEDNLFESESTRKWFDKTIEKHRDWRGEYDYKNHVIVEGKTKLRDPVVKKGVDKMMLFFVLEGLIKSTNIFEDLKNVNIRVPSDKVVFSSVDNQIGTSKYPDFGTYFRSWREREEGGEIRVGDPILIVEKGAASHYDYTWKHEEHRSRGYENRARDSDDIEPGVNLISFIESKDEYWLLKVDDMPYKVLEDGTKIYYQQSVTADRMGEPNVVCKKKYKFFVSCARHVEDWQRVRRDEWGREYLPSRVNNVNLHVYNDDFCPISYINSNYVLAWMEQKSIGDWYKGNYVYLVEKVFRRALEWLRERESHEMALILPLIPEWNNTPDELDALLSWRKANRVKNFTEWQAKRFVRWYKESGGLA